MVYINASFYYVRYSILLKCYRQLFLVNKFNLKLIVISILFTILFFVQQLFSLFFRLLDELFYFNYRNIKITAPVYIIANPRSGTTYLHRLMSMDEQRFAYMKFVYTLFPSVSFIKLATLIKKADNVFGNPLIRILDNLSNKFFGGWDDIHPMGFNKPEEDEAPFALAMMSPGIFLLFPYLDKIKDNWLLDNQPEKVQQHVMSYYKNCVQRFMFAKGKDKIYLSKNVMMSGRINSLLKIFPDARFVYIARHPYNSLPSFISMFATMYHVHSKQIKNDDEAMRAWAELGTAFYLHFFEARKKIAANNQITLKYEDLIANPVLVVNTIYNKFDLKITTEFESKLLTEQSKARNFKSAHKYSLEQYGLSKLEIQKQLQPVFEEFGFEK